MINGCSYGKVTRQMVIDIKDDVKDIKESCNSLSNHYSKRLPHWATLLISLLTTVCGVSLTIALK